MTVIPKGDEHRSRSPEHTVSLLRATLDATADGILVVDRAGQIVLFNARFAKMWDISPVVLASPDHELALAEAVSRVKDPDGFLARVAELYDRPEEKSFDVIELLDGRQFERYSRPQREGDEILGRVWSFRDTTKRTRAEAALRDSEERYRRLFHESRQAIYMSTTDGTLLEANPAALHLFGYGPEDVPGAQVLALYVDPHERAAFQERVKLEGVATAHPVRLRSRDGREMECMLTSSALRDDSGQIIGYQGIVEDVTARLETERALRTSERKFRSLIEGASDTITIVDQTGTILYESPSLERVLGWKPDELIGQSVFDFVHHDDLAGTLGQFQRIIEDGGDASTLELRFKHKDGTWRTLEAVGRNLLHDPDVAGIIVNARDVTERKKAEARLRHDAFHDRLTQLPNRALFMDRVTQSLRRSGRKDAAPFAVLFLDLDRFKLVNDSLGHLMGDQLLMAVARRLRDSLRPGDTVARLGGDEFTMLLDEATRADAEQVAERIQADLTEPFSLGEHQLYTAMSVGIATSSDEYATAEEMIRDADVAMYRAKDAGGARFEVFDASMRAQAVARLKLDTSLRQALEREEFIVHYQPIIDLASGSLRAFEALIRWNHPERGLLKPAAFLRAAEETGLIVPMGWWVLEQVCKQLTEWSAPGSPTEALPVHVNVSPLQLALPELVDRVADTVADAGTPAGLLHLELTESTMMENAEATVKTLHRLREFQVGLAIDDFGTGYSSLAYLHRFPTESVKIDRSFVARMGPRGQDSDIVRTIIDLARDLSMRVVAEGIETEAQAAALRAMRCDSGQGYLFARPAPVEEATRLLRERPTW